MMGRNKEAVEPLRQATRVNGQDEVAYNNLGATLIALNRPKDAAEAFREAIKLNPGAISSLVNMDHAFRQYCWWWRRKTIAATLLSVTHRQMEAGVDLSLQTYPALTYNLPAQDLIAISKYRAKMLLHRVGGRIGDPARCKIPVRGISKLRIGLLSSDYGEHPVAYAMNEVVCLRNSERFENYLYATSNSQYNSDRSPLRHKFRRCATPDPNPNPNPNPNRRQKFRRCATEFRDITSLDFSKSADTICQDQVHILFDLNGYSTGARSEVFPFRPALQYPHLLLTSHTAPTFSHSGLPSYNSVE